MTSPDERSVSDGRACLMCLAGMHSLCENDPCCCGGAADAETLLLEHDVATSFVQKQMREQYGLSGMSTGDGIPAIGGLEPRTKGDSGYIHPDAWPSPRDIGTFDDPKSTGRKRQAEMYPIQKGQACEWASMVITLGDLPAIVGCVNNPATDLHHGPDKNTLNNESASRGVGVLDNTWAICSECHNSAHSKHDDFYPQYDRIAQQAQPWLPRDITLGMTYQLVDAPIGVLFAEEEKRAKDRARRGRTSRGRQAKTLEEGRFDVRDEA